jgi:hypothetical protein
MFGGFGAARAAQQYRDGKKAHATLPRREVDTAEFLRLAVAVGMSEKDAATVERMCRIMGSATQVGGEILTVKK